MKKMSAIILIISLCIPACKNEPKINSQEQHAGHLMPAGSGNYCDSINAGLISGDTMKGSPHRMTMATVNGTHVHIEYGSPGVKDRVIWGGLVAYDKIWVTGAHNATSIQFSQPVMIGGKTIPKGTYGFFTIPGKENWEAIINGRYEQHLADDYQQSEDLVRVTVKPTENVLTPRLTYTVKPVGTDQGEISMQWEKLEIRLPFKTNAK